MEFTIGEYVVYGTAGICVLEGTEKRSFDGINENEYYRLSPVYSKSSTYYIPASTVETKLRKLLSKDEIYAIIDNMPNIEPLWYSDKNERKSIFSSVLKSDDYEKIICMIKSLHFRQTEQLSAGRKLSASDETALKSAENMMYQEFGIVLGIKPDDVRDFIVNRIDAISA